jgi:hypothetical protein
MSKLRQCSLEIAEKTLELYFGLRDIVEPPGFVGVVVQQTKVACEAELGWHYATASLRTGIVLSVYSFLHKAELSPCLLNFFVLFFLSPSICICCRVNVDDLDQTSMHCCFATKTNVSGEFFLQGPICPSKFLSLRPIPGTVRERI